MQYILAPLALAALAAALPQASSSNCMSTYPGTFEIQIVNGTAMSKRQSTALKVTLKDGTLTDASGRIADIVANHQFQFDPAPGQAGYIYNSGWAVCPGNLLAINGKTQFYKCLSGDFYNLYDENTADQCSPITIEVINGSGGSASQLPDGQVTGSAVQQMSDGQVTGSPVMQIADGQLQMPSGAPVQQISDGQLQATTAAPKAPVQQISDGQLQATSAVPKATGAPVQQISDGQLQASTAAPKATGSPVQQIGDGQLQSNGTATMPSPAQYTGAASAVLPQIALPIFLAAAVYAL